MSQQAEREFKNLLTASEYQRLQQAYSFTIPFKQTNLYFDTATQELKQRGWGLRLRLFKDRAEQTLKVPAHGEHDLWEITDPLPLSVAQQVQIQQPSQVSQYLQKYNIDRTQLQLIGYAQTERQQAILPAGLLVLDRTSYADTTFDYELELEVQDTASTSTTFRNLLNTQQIEPRKTTNKVARAVAHFQNISLENQYANLERMLFD
ncbi:CYTH domain-containing protein [Loigolactobacillus coryniformis]|uniref:CYTH domain-containing protein n=1 Tax=Loigolactobacillus coryniformis TaxID=1610 RepID=UPI00345DD1FB